MNGSNVIALAVTACVLLCTPGDGYSDSPLVWGENVGLVTAYVDKIDTEMGLSVHAAPSTDSPIVAYLQSGTKLLGYNEFKNGWVRLKNPVDGGWIGLVFLKPNTSEAIVTRIDNPQLCLEVKDGPGASYKKVSCAEIGETLKSTGVMTSDNWIQLADRKGWVDGASVQVVPEPPVSKVASTPPQADAAESVQTQIPETNTVWLTEDAAVPRSDLVSKDIAIGSAKPGASSPESVPQQSMTEPGAEKRSVEVCNGGWCVDYENAQMKHDGLPVSGAECLKNTICAGIVSQHHVAKATLDGTMAFGNFELSASGVISDSGTGKEVAKCGKAGGIDHTCVANFLRKAFASVTEDKHSVSEKIETPKEQIKRTSEKTEAKKPQSSVSSYRSKSKAPESEMSTSSFSGNEEMNKLQQRNIKDSWDDATRMGF